MDSSRKPDLKLASRVLPKPLLKAVEYIFHQRITGCALVGGTALSGYYAGHRKSDDLDLFTKNGGDQRATVLAVKSLAKIGAKLTEESSSAQYYHTQCEFEKHHFTIDVVEDSNLFRVGRFHVVDSGVVVAGLTTLLRMKIATLVSRCSEKDLYDLKWLLGHFSHVRADDLVTLGKSIDGGVNAENILAVLSEVHIREQACDFSLSHTISAKMLSHELKIFRKLLVKEFVYYLHHLPAPPLGALAKKARKVLK